VTTSSHSPAIPHRAATTVADQRYLAPGWATRHLTNPVMALLSRAGISVRGSRVLHVQGRSSGAWQTVPVNPLTIDGRQYLVAPRGQTQWVRNLRAAGTGRLQLGRRTTSFNATEVLDDDIKAPLLQSYLCIWRSEVGTFFSGIDTDSLDAIRAVAAGYPVFQLHPAV
jgi:deazaflavin-dependent oxidoreductase (nitroreductase family)